MTQDVPSSTTYTVAGTVTSPDSPSVGGLSLRLVDKNVGQADDVLVSGITLADGTFTLAASVTAEQLRAHRKTSPDLQVQVEVAGTVVASSAVAWSAGVDEELNVELPTGLASLPSEFETLTGALAQLYPGALSTLVEGADRQDITYLANTTGWDARTVAMASQAATLSELGVPSPNAQAAPGSASTSPPTTGAAAPSSDPTATLAAPFFYALLRAGLPADPATLFLTSTATVSAVWSQAIAQNIIPNDLATQSAAALDQFQTIAAGYLLDATSTVGPSTLDDLLTPTFGADTASKQTFATLYARYGSDPTELWSQVESTFSSSQTAQLQLNGQLAFLTLNNAPLVEALHAATKSQPITAVSDLVAQGYYQASAWTTVLSGVTPPSEIPGDSPEETSANYAEFLAAQVRLGYPTGSLAGLMGSGAVELGDATLQSAVSAFLTDQQSTFNIGEEPIDQFLTRTGTTATPDVVDQVARLQRVYQITPSDQALAVLIGAGVDSALAVTRYSQAAFVAQFATPLGGADVASLVYSRAQMVHATTLNIAVNYLAARSSPL
ncbi:MAG: hypothetical protein ACLQOZ_13635 [Acidimicrobiales bacterium]